MLSFYKHYKELISNELGFWKSMVFDKNKPPTVDPVKVFDETYNVLEQYLPNILKRKSVRILDIGSGPISVFNKLISPNVQVYAIDPLAHEYIQLNISDVCVRPINIKAEMIGEIFPDMFFDIVWASNSLDHAMSPHFIVQQIDKVLKNDGVFCCQTNLREANRMKYHGLHQFNIVLTPTSFIEENTQCNLLAGTNLKIDKFQQMGEMSAGAVFIKN